MAEAETPKDKTAAGAAQPAEGERVLNQDEIDTLLGFDGKQESKEARTDGIFAILDKSMTAYEKLPMLEVVFDRLVRQLSTSLRNFTSENVDVSLDSMVSIRFDDYLNSIPLPALLVVFRAVEWENFGLVTVDSSQIYSMVDILLGGRKANRPVRVEGRPYTTIEQDIVKRMIDIVLADMGSAFEPLSPATFHFERLESNPRFATITRPGNPALLVRFRVDMVENHGGVIEVLLPHTTLEPIRDLLLQMFMGENFGQDTVWEKHLGKELRSTSVEVEAVLQEKTVTLKDVMSFKVGNTVLLDCAPDDDVIMRCGGIDISSGTMGKVGDHIAVSLREPIRRKMREAQP
ncbi:MAG: flagellar motor switch protein FliM [Pseudomonadota bacterium]|nr:flagellar motor switch protein FliM [Pseudomonadota bacterium]MDE3037112.1 flagellar motor switch protein FliM [Pseudomonadota bacterium]